jgi:hypothetical protein
LLITCCSSNSPLLSCLRFFNESKYESSTLTSRVFYINTYCPPHSSSSVVPSSEF